MAAARTLIRCDHRRSAGLRLVAQVPVVNHFRWMRWLRSQKEWWELLDRIEEDRQRRYDAGARARIPVSTLDSFYYRPLLQNMMAKTKEGKTGQPPLGVNSKQTGKRIRIRKK